MLHPITALSSKQCSDKYPESHFYNLCEVEIRKGFSGERWMRLRVPIPYRDNIMKKLQSKFPEYTYSPHEVTFIWIEGNLKVDIKCSIHEAKDTYVIWCYERHLNDVLKALQAHRAKSKYNWRIGFWNNKKCIIRSDFKPRHGKLRFL